MKQKAIIYTRVSTTDQANSGYSLAHQKEACTQFAKQNGYEVIRVFEERGESAKTTDRTELKAMLNYCSLNYKDIDALIVWKSDRLSRNFDDHYALATIFTKLSIKILFATENNDDTAEGRLNRNILKSISEYENELKTQRTKAGMKQALREGKWLWQAPYGYKLINGEMFHDENSAHIVKKIYTLFAKGLYTQSQIRDILKRENIIIKPGRMFTILRNPVYCGNIICPSLCDKVVKGAFQPIITEELFNKVQMLLNNKGKITSSYARNNPEFPLKQFIICPICGSPLTASKSTGRKNKKYAYYHCYNKNCKAQTRVSKDKLEDLFLHYLSRLKPEHKHMKAFKKILKECYDKAVKDTKNLYKKLNQDLSSLEEKQNKLVDMYIEGKIRENDYKLKSESYSNEVNNIKNTLSTMESPKDDFNKCVDFVCESLENIDKLWIDCDLDTKQRLQQLIFPKGLVYKIINFEPPKTVYFSVKKEPLWLLILIWYPQANSNRCLHRERVLS